MPLDTTLAANSVCRSGSRKLSLRVVGRGAWRALEGLVMCAVSPLGPSRHTFIVTICASKAFPVALAASYLALCLQAVWERPLALDPPIP